jgi:hypothetical protein
MEYLSQEGFRPKEEQFGIYFKNQGLAFLIHWDEEDRSFLRICLPGIFSSDENNRNDVLEVLNKINYERKVVKGILVDDDVWVSTEQLLDSTPNYEDIIPRTLDMLIEARDRFYEYLRNWS